MDRNMVILKIRNYGWIMATENPKKHMVLALKI
jgi:hypothetical protein